MTTRRALRWALLLLAVRSCHRSARRPLPLRRTGAGAPRPPRPPQSLQSQDTNFPGIVADLTECKRKDGVLSVKVRLRNTSRQAVDVTLVKNRNYDEFYVTAAGKKYFILRDIEADADCGRRPTASGRCPSPSRRAAATRGGRSTLRPPTARPRSPS